MEIEITRIPQLTQGESALLDMHSMLNIVSILAGELQFVGLHLADTPALLRDGLAICEHVKASFFDPILAVQIAAVAPEIQRGILTELNRHLGEHPAPAQDPQVRESCGNIHSVLRILELRAREILARTGQPNQWRDCPVSRLLEELREVFAAIARNSKGRYGIVHDAQSQQPGDYLIELKVQAVRGEEIALPLIFTDVMRDLAANARKYTRPGGRISIHLGESATELSFTVEDTGCGIPADELEQVVHFGRRGSNTQDIRTLGGGFGLTKAFLVTKQLGGRFWIRSEVGVGTRISIVLPRSAPSRAETTLARAAGT